MLLLDTSGLLAALFPDQREHDRCARALAAAEGPLVLSPFVLAEVDYLVTKLRGVAVELELLAEVARGAYQLAVFGAEDVDQARRLIHDFADLGIGIADASIAVLSRRLGADTVLTLDERHFRALRGHRGRPFRLLPADAA